MKTTAISYPNIAFNKYWGNQNEKLRIPLNNTISMNLDGLVTKTTIDFSMEYKNDILILNGQQTDSSRAKIPLDYVKNLAGISLNAKIVSENNFPAGAGIASSASAYSALAMAACSALDLALEEKEISAIARLGSGSACRSIPGGFAEWVAGDSHETSYAYQIAAPEDFGILDIVAIVSGKEKKISSTIGHKLVETSPYKDARLAATEHNLRDIKKGILNNDFKTFGEALERDAIEMHCVAMTSEPRVFYWEPETLALIKGIMDMRENGIAAYSTTDAGPNLHIITLPKFKDEVSQFLKKSEMAENVFVCKPAGKPYFVEEHLF